MSKTPTFEFDRYINGVLMAEGVTIERQPTFDKACVRAAELASYGKNGEIPVLVYRGHSFTAEAARAQGAEVHPDDLAVDRFAAAMKAKLAQKRDEGRSGWDNPDECTIEFLSKLLREHVDKGDPVDVANFAMMVHQRAATITADTTSEPDWWYRDYDPDDSGDSPHEALSHVGDGNVCLLHSSYRGPSKWAFRAQTLATEDDETEVLLFDSQDEAIAASKERMTALDALAGREA